MVFLNSSCRVSSGTDSDLIGTVISIHPTPNLDFTSPITRRLRQRDTGLRNSADSSMLVQSMLDLGMSFFHSSHKFAIQLKCFIVVDQALVVVDEYHGKILKLEHDI